MHNESEMDNVHHTSGNEDQNPPALSPRFKYLAILVSLMCAVLIFLHGIYPQFLIDSVTIALVVILIFPWLLPYVRSLKLPGGTEVNFKDPLRQLDRPLLRPLTRDVSAQRPKTTSSPIELTRRDLFRSDPNLALASLRIDIENELRKISVQRNLPVKGEPLRAILDRLQLQGVIGNPEFDVLLIVISVCNRAVHAEKVDQQDASQILDIGESMLSRLRLVQESHTGPS